MKLGPLQKQWIQSLKDHPERQMKGYLGKRFKNGNYKCCCLGEGGLIAGVCKWNFYNILTTDSETESNYNLSGVHKSLGLRSGVGESIYEKEGMPSLTLMNDAGMSWPEIAVILETFPEEYFIKSV